jgi:fibronectin type 3 domain-containing protein
MPALYAASYKGDNGKTYVLVTNKSSQSQQVTVRVDGKTVKAPIVKAYTTASDPAAKNNPQKTNAVSILSENTANPVTIPPYSVTRLEWTRSEKPETPRESWLYAAKPAGGTSVNLQWYGTENATGYKIMYGTKPGAYTQSADAGKALSFTVKGLTAGQTYYFATTAYNASGESPSSPEMAVQLAKPEAPVIRAASPETSGKVIVEWQSVPGADGYKVMYGTAPGAYTSTAAAGNNAGILIGGLQNDTRYYFAVTSYNALGESAPSAPVEATPKELMPLAPKDLTIKSETDASVSLIWKPARMEVASQTFEDGTKAGLADGSGAWTVQKHPNPAREVMGIKPAIADGAVNTAVWSQTPGGSYEGLAVVEWVDSRAEGQVGVAARYVDKDNHIRFVYDRKDMMVKLIKVVQGKEQLLGSRKVQNAPNRSTMLITIDGNNVYGKLNNEGTILKAADTALPSGKLAVYSSDPGVWVDAVRLYATNTSGYSVYRSTNPSSGFEPVASGLKAPAFIDSGLVPGQTYYYKVQAENEFGLSRDFSNIIRKN